MTDWSSPPSAVEVHVFRRAVPAEAARIWATHARSEIQHRLPGSVLASRAVIALIAASETGGSECKIVGLYRTVHEVLDWCESVPGWYYGDVPAWIYTRSHCTVDVEVQVLERRVPVDQALQWAQSASKIWHDDLHLLCQPDVRQAVRSLIDAARDGVNECRVNSNIHVIDDAIAWCESVPGWWCDHHPVWMYVYTEEVYRDIPTETDD